MSDVVESLRQWLDAHVRCAVVEIADAQGSTPRERGAFMIVSGSASHGTIGGGQMEFHALDRARELIVTGSGALHLDLALGPHLGQCCGGRVTLLIKVADAADLERLQTLAAAEARPQVYIFGAGHTGLALARALAPLPFRVTLIDDREGMNAGSIPNVAFLRLDDPAQAVADAPAGSAFVILTHSHALDYALVDVALRKDSVGYVGMIGSATKLARFRQWFRARGGAESALRDLICPIGGKLVGDKRPEVIAALTATELIHRFLTHNTSENGLRSGKGSSADPDDRGVAA